MRAPRFHLLTASPAELAEFWVAQAHELRMAGMEALDLPQLARQCDTCTGELLMLLELLKLLPVTPDETVLDDAMKDFPRVYEDKVISDDELPKSYFLTPEEVAALLAPVKPKHYRKVKGA